MEKQLKTNIFPDNKSPSDTTDIFYLRFPTNQEQRPPAIVNPPLIGRQQPERKTKNKNLFAAVQLSFCFRQSFR